MKVAAKDFQQRSDDCWCEFNTVGFVQLILPCVIGCCVTSCSPCGSGNFAQRVQGQVVDEGSMEPFSPLTIRVKLLNNGEVVRESDAFDPTSEGSYFDNPDAPGGFQVQFLSETISSCDLPPEEDRYPTFDTIEVTVERAECVSTFTIDAAKLVTIDESDGPLIKQIDTPLLVPVCEL